MLVPDLSVPAVGGEFWKIVIKLLCYYREYSLQIFFKGNFEIRLVTLS